MNKQPEFVNNYFASIYLTIIAFLQGAAIFQLTPYLVSFFYNRIKPFHRYINCCTYTYTGHHRYGMASLRQWCVIFTLVSQYYRCTNSFWYQHNRVLAYIFPGKKGATPGNEYLWMDTGFSWFSSHRFGRLFRRSYTQ